MQIRHVILHTDRFAEIDRFYSDILGFEVVERGLDFLSYQVGASHLTFKRIPTADPSPCYHFAINIPSNQFEAAKAWLSSRTPLLNNDEGEDEFTFEAMEARAVYFRDPAHNIGEVIARDIVAEKEGPFALEHLLSISEIGLPLRGVIEHGTLMKEAFGLKEYVPLNEAFGALGNPEGLLILVREGRGWLPTNAPAAVFPTEIELSGCEEGELDIPDHPYTIRTQS